MLILKLDIEQNLSGPQILCTIKSVEKCLGICRDRDHPHIGEGVRHHRWGIGIAEGTGAEGTGADLLIHPILIAGDPVYVLSI